MLMKVTSYVHFGHYVPLCTLYHITPLALGTGLEKTVSYISRPVPMSVCIHKFISLQHHFIVSVFPDFLDKFFSFLKKLNQKSRLFIKMDVHCREVDCCFKRTRVFHKDIENHRPEKQAGFSLQAYQPAQPEKRPDVYEHLFKAGFVFGGWF